MNKYTERLYNGLIKENPTTVMLLGMCPTLATTTSLINGIGMGLCTLVVLVLSNIVISLLRKIIPDEVRIPAFIVVIASLVTIVQFLMEGYFPDLSQSLGVYIPLIVVNCIILGRAEAYASKHSVGLSAFDGIGMGLGFTIALGILGGVRELFGNGTIAGMQVMPKGYVPISIFVLQPGAFFVLAALIALVTYIMSKREQKKREKAAAEAKAKKPVKAKAKPQVQTASCAPSDCAGCAAKGGCGVQIFAETARAGLRDNASKQIVNGGEPA